MTESDAAQPLDAAQKWLFKGLSKKEKKETASAHWWKVMCLTGVDYFSTLGYQPGIAFLAASYLSPLATLVLVFFTLFAALPIYKRVAAVSPHGQGSVAMLEHLLPGWQGKVAVLILLGFAATDFIITITLSAADAAQHAVENPFLKEFALNPEFITNLLLLLLASIFLIGFKEAIGIAVVLVTTYLTLNLVVVFVCAQDVFARPEVINAWTQNLTTQCPSMGNMVLMAFLLFPKLALGLSGFETGVAVMPLVKGNPDEPEEAPAGRIANTRTLLACAAFIMSFFLIATSLMTTLLIPSEQFQAGGQANGRALAFLAHKYLGDIFGTAYDVSTIAILWFAGASAMAGLLNLVPRYLPRFGMAPDWARAMRPLILVLTVVSIYVTFYFHASVDAQGAAYATGVLVLMTSAALAVTLHDWSKGTAKRLAYSAITLLFIYTTITNVVERPEGLRIASCFILGIIAVSFISRLRRSTELRIENVVWDEEAQKIIAESTQTAVKLIAHHPGKGDYQKKLKEIVTKHNIDCDCVIFIEVSVEDASEFTEDVVKIKGHRREGFPVLTCDAVAIPNALSAILLNLKKTTGKQPHIYLGWTEGSPLLYVLKFVFLGDGETAAVTREILRVAEADPDERPCVHVA